MTTPINSSSSAAVRMLAGGSVGLLLIALFLFSVDEVNPSWGKYWMIRPLIIVPLAGAFGGLCQYWIMKYYSLAGLNKIMAIILSVLVFIIGLWMGVVLGLDGTLWD
jgi:hypothetical protein